MSSNRNNPNAIVSSPKFDPPRNWKNWTSVETWSACPGLWFPVKWWDLPANATPDLNIRTAVESTPAVSPLYGHFIMIYKFFFCPYRLYVPNLNNNNVNDLTDIEQIEFPVMFANSDGLPYFVNITNGSLLDYLGYAKRKSYISTNPNLRFINLFGAIDVDDPEFNRVVGYTTNPNNGDFVYDVSNVIYPTVVGDDDSALEMLTDNAIPWLAYYDIFSHHLANPNEEFIPFINADGESQYVSLHAIQAIAPYVSGRGQNAGLYGVGDTSNRWQLRGIEVGDGSNPSYIYDPYVTSVDHGTVYLVDKAAVTTDSFVQDYIEYLKAPQYNHFGMMPCNYLPDYFTTWVDPDDYNVVNDMQLPNMNIMQIRLQERKWVDYARQLARRSKRLTDWVENKYGGPKLKLNNEPILVGEDKVDVYFQNITAQSNSGDGSKLSDYVGGQASRISFMTPKTKDPIKFTTQEPGLLMCMCCLVPEVSYTGGVDRFLKKRRMADLYTPLYDAVGFQSIYAYEVKAGSRTPLETIGDVPGWYEYMSKTNHHKGLFELNEFKSWVLERDFTDHTTDVSYGDPDVVNSTYVDEDMFDYNFVDVGLYKDNFYIQTLFDFKIKLPMSDQIVNLRY